MFSDIDKSGDGKISKEEFLGHMVRQKGRRYILSLLAIEYLRAMKINYKLFLFSEYYIIR